MRHRFKPRLGAMIYLALFMKICVQALPAVPSDLVYVGPSTLTSEWTQSDTKNDFPSTTDTEEFAPNGPVPSSTVASSARMAPISTFFNPSRNPTTTTPLTTARAGAAPSYVIAQPSVVTLQIVNGQLVQASEAPVRYTLAAPEGKGVQGSLISGPEAALRAPVELLDNQVSDTTRPVETPIYVNPLVRDSFHIISSSPASCTRPCTPFRKHYTSCTMRHPPLTRSGADLTEAENATNITLSECLCDYTYQAQTCGQCLVSQGMSGGAVRGLVEGCQALEEGKMERLVAADSGMGEGRSGAIGQGTAGAMMQLQGMDDVSETDGERFGAEVKGDQSGSDARNGTALQGVDAVALAMICNATGLAAIDPKAYKSCMNGTNVAAILNTTDTVLRQALSPLRPNHTAAPVSDGADGEDKTDDGSRGQRVDEYCAMVHVNDYFWAQTCGRKPPANDAARIWKRGTGVWVTVGLVACCWMLA